MQVVVFEKRIATLRDNLDTFGHQVLALDDVTREKVQDDLFEMAGRIDALDRKYSSADIQPGFEAFAMVASADASALEDLEAEVEYYKDRVKGLVTKQQAEAAEEYAKSLKVYTGQDAAVMAAEKARIEKQMQVDKEKLAQLPLLSKAKAAWRQSSWSKRLAVIGGAAVVGVMLIGLFGGKK